MKTIIAYIILQAYGLAGASLTNELQNHVSKKIQEGYQPYGSIACVDSEGGFVKCYQPMVKYAEAGEERK